MTENEQIALEDLAVDVTHLICSIDHLCDLAKKGHLQAMQFYRPELLRGADSLSELTIKLIDMNDKAQRVN